MLKLTLLIIIQMCVPTSDKIMEIKTFNNQTELVMKNVKKRKVIILMDDFNAKLELRNIR